MDHCAVAEGHLVIFDCDLERTWDEKVYRRLYTKAGRRLRSGARERKELADDPRSRNGIALMDLKQ